MPSSVFSKTYIDAISALAVARRDAGLTQSELALRLKKPQSYVSKYERGERRLDIVEYLAATIAIGSDPLGLLAPIMDDLYQVRD